jgi:hypothetical protein
MLGKNHDEALLSSLLEAPSVGRAHERAGRAAKAPKKEKAFIFEIDQRPSKTFRLTRAPSLDDALFILGTDRPIYTLYCRHHDRLNCRTVTKPLVALVGHR